jgi:hypothetical protein
MSEYTSAPDSSDDDEVLPTEAHEGGKAGEGGGPQISNEEFIRSIFTELVPDTHAAVCIKDGDPDVGGWTAKKASLSYKALLPATNNYLACSTFRATDGEKLRATKTQFSACYFFMLDDIGTKVDPALLKGIELSWLIETSPGNHQGGIILSQPLEDSALAGSLHDAIRAKGLCDNGASGVQTRWARLPVAINGKSKYRSEEGQQPSCCLKLWNPAKRYTPAEIIDLLHLELPAQRPAGHTHPSGTSSGEEDEVLTPRARLNPVVAAFQARGLYKTPLGSAKHDVICPWVDEHTDAKDSGSAYFEPSEGYPLGGYCCQHSHREKYRIGALLEFLGVRAGAARHKPVIRIVAGDMNRVLDAAESELANLGQHYQAGGLIVSISTDPNTGNPTIVPTSAPALTRELARAASWERYSDRHGGSWTRTDPPTRHVAILYESQNYLHLLPLKGLARQPYFRESDGELVTQPGYDRATQRYGVFAPQDFSLPEPTLAAAKDALALLEELLREFHFVAAHDKAAALAAMLTAAVRPSLEYAPAFHVHASVFGSGKTYLCDLIGAFAGPGGNAKVSYPTTSEEATKVILSLLLTNPAVVEFDDMDSDWTPHGTIKRMLTASQITDRILGVSRTATVSTRTLFLGSGNNVGPVRDLLRRVLTINLNPRCATPATITYTGNPVEQVRQHRSKYVCAALTIIQAYRGAGMPRPDADSIVTYSGAWSEYCRFPLMWLGLPDPATALLSQIRHDPDGDALKVLLEEMHAEFGTSPTTVRNLVCRAVLNLELNAAISEFPVVEHGHINPSKLGWLLKRYANRIVGGYELRRGQADGRTAWCVALVEGAPPSPPSPPSA